MTLIQFLAACTSFDIDLDSASVPDAPASLLDNVLSSYVGDSSYNLAAAKLDFDARKKNGEKVMLVREYHENTDSLYSGDATVGYTVRKYNRLTLPNLTRAQEVEILKSTVE